MEALEGARGASGSTNVHATFMEIRLPVAPSLRRGQDPVVIKNKDSTQPSTVEIPPVEAECRALLFVDVGGCLVSSVPVACDPSGSHQESALDGCHVVVACLLHMVPPISWLFCFPAARCPLQVSVEVRFVLFEAWALKWLHPQITTCLTSPSKRPGQLLLGAQASANLLVEGLASVHHRLAWHHSSARAKLLVAHSLRARLSRPAQYPSSPTRR